MENFNKSNIEIDIKAEGTVFERNKLLNSYLKKINDCFDKENKNFADLCYYVYQVWKLLLCNNYYDKKGNYITFKGIMESFGLTETEVCRLKSCYNKFMFTELSEDHFNIINYGLKAEFKDFTKSKLFELLNVETEQLIADIHNKVLRSDMSVKSIRDYVKNYNSLQRQNKKLADKQVEEQVVDNVEEEIPEAYNPNKHYDFAYFETKTKSQLLNIVWQLQQEYQKLKLNKEKKQKNGI